jgi:uncharacterized coiled-coil DUF342 family protein
MTENANKSNGKKYVLELKIEELKAKREPLVQQLTEAKKKYQEVRELKESIDKAKKLACEY